MFLHSMHVLCVCVVSFRLIPEALKFCITNIIKGPVDDNNVLRLGMSDQNLFPTFTNRSPTTPLFREAMLDVKTVQYDSHHHMNARTKQNPQNKSKRAGTMRKQHPLPPTTPISHRKTT